jgi:hypothetical protein
MQEVSGSIPLGSTNLRRFAAIAKAAHRAALLHLSLALPR